MKKHVGIVRVYVLVIILLQVMLITGVGAIDTNQQRPLTLNSAHEITLEALGWEVTAISCLAGDSLSGEFTLTSNGDLFIGDQTKYDNWLLDGIDFLILDATNYALWKDDLAVTSLYEREGVFELQWAIEVPSEGIWYIIYYNDSIFMKTVEGNIQRISPYEFTYTFVIATLLSLTSLLALLFIYKKKK